MTIVVKNDRMSRVSMNAQVPIILKNLSRDHMWTMIDANREFIHRIRMIPVGVMIK